MFPVIPILKRYLFKPVNTFLHWGTEEGQTNLARLRQSTLNICAGFFISTTTILFFVRLFQGRFVHAGIELIAILMVIFSMWLARSGRFNMAAWLLAIGPVLLAFSLVKLGLFRGVHMVPQIAMCMLTLILIFDRLIYRISYIAACLALMTSASFTDLTHWPQYAIFLGQSLGFATIFICFVYFFERQDQRLNQTIKELQASNDEKNAANQALNDRVEELVVFSHIMSHDLKGPLTAITGYTDLIKLDLETNTISEETHESADAISTASSSMSSIITNLLTYSKVSLTDAGVQRVDMNKVVEAVTNLLSYQIRSVGASIEAANLPAIEGNADMLKTLLYNLISNGLKYQPIDRPEHRPAIKIWHETDEKMIHLFIKDNGIGIAPAYQDQLFTPFKRDHASEYEGTGLGMSICQSIAEKFKGEIIVNATGPDGTTFRLSFPMVPDEQPSPQVLPELEAQPRTIQSTLVLNQAAHPNDITRP